MITMKGMAYCAPALIYISIVSLYAFWVELYSPHKKIGYLGVIALWLIPPFYWLKYTNIFTRPPAKLGAVILGPISIALIIYCFVIISGVLGLGMRESGRQFALAFVSIAWFMLPTSVTVAVILSGFLKRNNPK